MIGYCINIEAIAHKHSFRSHLMKRCERYAQNWTKLAVMNMVEQWLEVAVSVRGTVSRLEIAVKGLQTPCNAKSSA